MLVSRSEIEKRFRTILISDEEGMKFQGLQLSYWPSSGGSDFIACERKKDRGADAIGDGKILACCLRRADFEKLKSDATKVRQNFNLATVNVLVFATAEGGNERYSKGKNLGRGNSEGVSARPYCRPPRGPDRVFERSQERRLTENKSRHPGIS